MTDTDLSIPDHVRAAFGLPDAALSPLPADASTRRYARVTHPVYGPCLVLSDEAGTPHFERFLSIGRHLARLGFSTPTIHATDETAGFALVEDFGHSTYTRLLAEGVDEAELYALAIDVLVALHKAPTATEITLAPYDLAFLLQEVAILPDWFAPATGRALSRAEIARHDSLWREALASLGARRETLVIRDFHVDNLMLLEGRKGAAACGLLDFQGGLIGAQVYDLASLLQDARRDVPEALEQAMLTRYLDARDIADRTAFLRDYSVIAAQRHAKIVGLFHRLNTRDGKSVYLAHVPRVLRLLARALSTAGLTDIEAFYDETMPQWRV